MFNFRFSPSFTYRMMRPITTKMLHLHQSINRFTFATGSEVHYRPDCHATPREGNTCGCLFDPKPAKTPNITNASPPHTACSHLMKRKWAFSHRTLNKGQFYCDTVSKQSFYQPPVCGPSTEYNVVARHKVKSLLLFICYLILPCRNNAMMTPEGSLHQLFSELGSLSFGLVCCSGSRTCTAPLMSFVWESLHPSYKV